MKHILDKTQVLKNLHNINEGQTTKKGDVYEYRTFVSFPVSLVNAFVSKAKKDFNINVRENYADVEIVDMMFRYMTDTFLNIESLPVNKVLGTDPAEANSELTTDVQPTDVQPAAQPDVTVQEPVQAQIQPQIQPAQGQVDINAQVEEPTI